MSLPIEKYGLIGNCRGAALVGRDGSIDWMCLPRFDSGACFAALLGTEEHGYWRIAPAAEFTSSRRYAGETLVLETTFETKSGSCRVIDCMPIGTPGSDLIRIVEGVSGEVELHSSLKIRFDYGSIVPWLERAGPNDFQAIAGPDVVEFFSPVEMSNKDLTTRSRFTVRKGERHPFVLSWHASQAKTRPRVEDPAAAVEATLAWWKDWSEKCSLSGEARSLAMRSLLTLKALTYEPTGGIIAAPTTSLPEDIGGERNWDYRFCWLRDATFTLYSLMLSGLNGEAREWRDWLTRAVAGTPSEVNIMYGIDGRRRLTELELDWLPGYENSRPVREGNAAHDQVQLDVYGEVMDANYLAAKGGLKYDPTSWNVQLKMLEHLEGAWREMDEGMWEVRGGKKHFTHSKVMAWVAFDRAIKTAALDGRPAETARWKAVRDRIHEDVCANGFNAKLGAFVQAYGEEKLDAGLLKIALVGFLPATDPRIVGTIRAIEGGLMEDGFVLRYRAERGVDGLKGGEGAFLACSFWLADNYILQGRHADAKALFDRLLGVRNDLGLLSEEYDFRRGRLAGNFPQAFSHVALINTALNMTAPVRPAHDRAGLS